MIFSVPAFLVAAASVAKASTKCADVHMFLARGYNEAYPGQQAALVNAICTSVARCDYEDLIFSALATDLYCQRTYDGAIAGHKQLKAYASLCPDAKLVILGYSQGAQIVTDILGGAGGTLFNGCVQPEVPALDPIQKQAREYMLTLWWGGIVSAAWVFGDVRHTANQIYNFGNGSSIDSQFPRTPAMLMALNAYADVLRDWCVDTDGICASSSKTTFLASHLSYYDLYTAEAAAWVKKVAKLEVDDHIKVTAIPLSLSGTVQDYGMIGTATSSGFVSMDTEWTQTTVMTTDIRQTSVTVTKVQQTSASTSGSGTTVTFSESIAAPTEINGSAKPTFPTVMSRSVGSVSSTSTAAGAGTTGCMPSSGLSRAGALLAAVALIACL